MCIFVFACVYIRLSVVCARAWCASRPRFLSCNVALPFIGHASPKLTQSLAACSLHLLSPPMHTQACVEAGASLLEIQLVDGLHSSLLSVSPMLSVTSTDGCCAGAKLAVVAPPQPEQDSSPLPSPPSSPAFPAHPTSARPALSTDAHASTDPSDPAHAADLPPSPPPPSLDACVWYVPDGDQVHESTAIRTLLQALGACRIQICMPTRTRARVCAVGAVSGIGCVPAARSSRCSPAAGAD